MALRANCSGVNPVPAATAAMVLSQLLFRHRDLKPFLGPDRTKNPSGSGGFPFDKASASVGKQIVDYKTARIGEAILQVLRAK